MGHMHPESLCKFFVRRLYAKGKLTIRDAIDGAKKAKLVVSCSEGTYEDDYMYGMGFEHIVQFLLADHRYIRSSHTNQSPIIQPDRDFLTNEQRTCLDQWLANDNGFFEKHGDFDGDGMNDSYRALYAVPWRYTGHWRKKYPDIPILEEVTT